MGYTPSQADITREACRLCIALKVKSPWFIGSTHSGATQVHLQAATAGLVCGSDRSPSGGAATRKHRYRFQHSRRSAAAIAQPPTPPDERQQAGGLQAADVHSIGLRLTNLIEARNDGFH